MPTTMPADTQAVLDQVSRMHTFYADNWYHLLVFLGVALAIVGVVIPLMIHIWQTRTFHSAEATARREGAQVLRQVAAHLKTESTSHIDRFQKDLQAQIDTAAKALKSDFDTRMAVLDKEVARINAGYKGATLYLQAKTAIASKDYRVAFKSAVCAAEQLLISRDANNLDGALGFINDALSNLAKRDLDYVPPAIIDTFDLLLPTLEKVYDDGRFGRDVETLRVKMKLAQERTAGQLPPASPPN